MTCITRGSQGGGSIERRKRVRQFHALLLFGLLILTSFGVLGLHSIAVAAQKSGRSPAADQVGFLSPTAASESDPGTPVGPQRKVILCHRGHTIRVSSKAVQQHLSHGDTLGPCSQNVVICHRYGNSDSDHPSDSHRTIIINQKDLASYLAQGDVVGPCTNQVFMCSKGKKTIVVSTGSVNDRLARGQTLGLCSGKNLMCRKGKTIIVDDADVQERLNEGACLGYCYGAPGPLVSQTTPCASNPPTAFVAPK
jgi:hypothetical protein